MKEETLKNFEIFANNIDFAEICLSYLKWIIDNVNDPEMEYEIHYDVLECLNRFSLREQQLIQFKNKLDILKDKYEAELKDKPMNASYFEDVSNRLIKKFKQNENQEK